MNTFRQTAFSGALALSFVAVSSITSTDAYADVNENGLFGTVEISSTNLSALPQWQKVIDSFSDLEAAARKCDIKIEDCSSQQMTLWRAKINELRRTEPRLYIQEINRFLNSWKQTADFNQHGKDDHWSTPLEFISNGGDSEDIAIMKYVSLKELGLNPEAMRVVITNDVLRNIVHAVLIVQYRGKSYVLDSLNDTILSEEFVQYYVPLYSVNEQTRWAHIPAQTAVAAKAQGASAND
ncbi:MAG: transglutaminase-like cysteine peptidase [Proteobacteria bacterium]|nr:transglutaminase-like cysteine peptidase [Pseudomonadota bacterium]